MIKRGYSEFFEDVIFSKNLDLLIQGLIEEGFDRMLYCEGYYRNFDPQYSVGMEGNNGVNPSNELIPENSLVIVDKISDNLAIVTPKDYGEFIKCAEYRLYQIDKLYSSIN